MKQIYCQKTCFYQFLNLYWKLAIFSAILWASPNVSLARNLSRLELFKRCYAQFTQEAPAKTNAYYLKVKNSNADPIDVCIEVLEKAKLKATGTNQFLLTSSPNPDSIAASVLATFHQLHQTFFKFKIFPDVYTSHNDFNSMKLLDPGEPALFFDLSLFGDKWPVTNILQAKVNLRAIRGDHTLGINKNYAFDGAYKSTIPFANEGSSLAFSFAPWGRLTGVEITDSMKVDLIRKVDANDKPTEFDRGVPLLETLGGGTIGTRAYQYLAPEPQGFTSNVLKMHRSFAQAVFSDFLCRELPVVRQDEATMKFPVISPSDLKALSFRKGGACVTCHASMDQLAAVNRHFRYTSVGRFQVLGKSGFILPDHIPQPTLSAANPIWPSVEDKDYSKRPTQGALYYTNSDGVTILQPVNSLAELGKVISEQKDFYRCVTKKYYQYFLGVDVDIMDPKDGRYRNKGPQMEAHLKKVRELADNLQKDLDLSKLIKSILKSSFYKESNVGI